MSFRRCDWLFPPSAREVSHGNRSNYKSTRETVDSKGLYGRWRLHLMGSCFCIQNLSRKSNKSSTAYPLTVQIHTILCFPWGMGVGGTQQMFIPGGSAPRSNLLLFYIQFFKKKSTPFVYLLDNWYSFHIPCIELCITFTFCKCTVK